MYVAAHYLSDVVAAALIGVVAAYVVVHWKPLQIEIRNSKFENPRALCEASSLPTFPHEPPMVLPHLRARPPARSRP
jgi:membrane-associated phospholipid phosphatase